MKKFKDFTKKDCCINCESFCWWDGDYCCFPNMKIHQYNITNYPEFDSKPNKGYFSDNRMFGDIDNTMVLGKNCEDYHKWGTYMYVSNCPNEHLEEYKRLVNEAEIQINSIRNGLSKIIPLSVLQLFTGKELSMLVCGKKDIDIDLLRQNTKLSNDLKEDSKEVRWLWEILSEITPEEKIKFIKFCWAQERLPTSNEEYVKNQIAFTIKYNKDDKNKNFQQLILHIL